MDLSQHTREASVSYAGATRIVMPAGAKLRFQNTDGEGNFFDVTVPEGKEWSVRVEVHVTETTAA